MGCINCFDKFILLIWLPICTAPIAKRQASEHRRAQSIIKQQEARNAEQHQMIDVVLGYHRISHCSSRRKLVSQHCFCKRDRSCRGLGIYCASTITNRTNYGFCVRWFWLEKAQRPSKARAASKRNAGNL